MKGPWHHLSLLIFLPLDLVCFAANSDLMWNSRVSMEYYSAEHGRQFAFCSVPILRSLLLTKWQQSSIDWSNGTSLLIYRTLLRSCWVLSLWADFRPLKEALCTHVCMSSKSDAFFTCQSKRDIILVTASCNSIACTSYIRMCGNRLWQQIWRFR